MSYKIYKLIGKEETEQKAKERIKKESGMFNTECIYIKEIETKEEQ